MVKVLCVDDYPSILSLYQDELSEEGYEVMLAKDGKEAIEKFEKESPQAVVLEINGPAKDSIATLATMREENGQIPLILTTTYFPLCEKYKISGAEACLLKSSDLMELKQKIREALEKRGKGGKT